MSVEVERKIVELEQRKVELELRRLHLSVNDDREHGSQEEHCDNVGHQNRYMFPNSSVALPKLEIEVFDGNPCNFVGFMNAFQINIASVISNPAQKLSYLIHYCKGEAKEAIRHCSLLPPSEGYSVALDILRDNFGRAYQVSQAITTGLYDDPCIYPKRRVRIAQASHQNAQLRFDLMQTWERSRAKLLDLYR